MWRLEKTEGRILLLPHNYKMATKTIILYAIVALSYIKFSSCDIDDLGLCKLCLFDSLCDI